ncbi:hypothetical protein [Streptomyces sp. FIT100]|uniref:hypothetical protein n=1 Tax=Streptomyces sp. FIT100 TaxID=2837956 RepID=UPI0021C622DB|nr:hypothetical protein [Streptomyces sp. FIT100]UUN29117.1 hypothetical protein KK483_24095 [Streptomyces sp. FIT100]
MGSEGRRTVRRPQDEQVCPACGQPLGTVIKRRKVLGAFVPEWVRDACHNPDCGLGTEPTEGPDAADRGTGGRGDGEATTGSAAGPST